MIVARNIIKTRNIIKQVRTRGETVGFVPTMGCLHEGHLSLVKKAKKECDFVAVSIFVNPAQFGPNEDYKNYPRRFSTDKKLLERQKADLLFCPSAEEMYSPDFSVYVEENTLSRVLCGKSRPAHFKGVVTVVAKLFNIICPDVAYFGQKDYQQAQIIKRMTRDLNFFLKIKVLPIVREKDGLAMSSRNLYLDSEQRKQAACLYEALSTARCLINRGEKNSGKILGEMRKIVTLEKNAKIDYIEIFNADTLEPVSVLKGELLIVLAVYVGRTRLIDNIILNVKGG